MRLPGANCSTGLGSRAIGQGRCPVHTRPSSLRRRSASRRGLARPVCEQNPSDPGRGDGSPRPWHPACSFRSHRRSTGRGDNAISTPGARPSSTRDNRGHPGHRPGRAARVASRHCPGLGLVRVGRHRSSWLRTASPVPSSIQASRYRRFEVGAAMAVQARGGDPGRGWHSVPDTPRREPVRGLSRAVWRADGRSREQAGRT